MAIVLPQGNLNNSGTKVLREWIMKKKTCVVCSRSKGAPDISVGSGVEVEAAQVEQDDSLEALHVPESTPLLPQRLDP